MPYEFLDSLFGAPVEGEAPKAMTREELEAAIEGAKDLKLVNLAAGGYVPQADYDALKGQVETMTKAANLRDMRAKVAKDTGVPEDLLSADTEEACTAQAKAILNFAKPHGYPNVRDGGDPQHKPTGSTREQFAEWFNQVTK